MIQLNYFRIAYLLFLIFTESYSVILNQTCLQNATEIIKKYARKVSSKTATTLNDPNVREEFNLIIEGFETYSDILLSCNSLYDVSDTDFILLIPKYPILVDQTLQLEKMFNRYDVTIGLLNVKGIVAFRKLKTFTTFSKNLVSTINLLNSKLDV